LRESNEKLSERLKFYEEKDREYAAIIELANDKFGRFKSSMDSLQKSIANTESQNHALRQKFMKSDSYSVDLAI
jgi:tRNA(Phe) wybutosine-synthesizing methylase Tyw3